MNCHRIYISAQQKQREGEIGNRHLVFGVGAGIPFPPLHSPPRRCDRSPHRYLFLFLFFLYFHLSLITPNRCSNFSRNSNHACITIRLSLFRFQLNACAFFFFFFSLFLSFMLLCFHDHTRVHLFWPLSRAATISILLSISQMLWAWKWEFGIWISRRQC